MREEWHRTAKENSFLPTFLPKEKINANEITILPLCMFVCLFTLPTFEPTGIFLKKFSMEVISLKLSSRPQSLIP
jgi:hypothetical protein